MKTFIVAVWLLLSIQFTDAQRRPKRGVFREVRGCFAENDDQAEINTCISNFTSCLNATTVDTVKTCVADKGGRGEGVVKSCMEPYTTCFKEEGKARLNKIPKCIRTTLRELGKCFRKNATTCAETCSEDDIPKSNPFKNLNPDDILICDKFQEIIMEPTCDVLDCCSECIDKYENMMNCIADEVLNMTLTDGDTCVVDCTTSESRKLEEKSRELEELEEPTDDTVGEQCAYYIDVDGEQEGTDSFKNGIRQKIASSDFIDCVALESFAVAEEQAKYNEENPDGSDSGAATDSILSASVLAIMGMMTIF